MALMVPDAPRTDVGHFLEFAESSVDSLAGHDDAWSEPVENTFRGARDQLHRLRRGFHEPFRIAVVGEFNAGKTSLINALLMMPGRLIEGIVPTTGAVTELRGSGDELGEVFDHAGNLIFSGKLEEATPYTDQRTPQGRSINGKGARVVLRVDADLLQNLVIIDTPGLGANHQDDETTREALIEADAAILVVNGLRPGGDDSEVLAERLRKSGRTFITAVTRLDRASNPDDALDVVRQLYRGISEGEPVGLRMPDITTALGQLAAAAIHDDPAGREAAEAALERAGYTELRNRVNESLIVGDGTRGRAVRALRDVVHVVRPLHRQAIVEADRSQAGADAVKVAEDEANRLVNEVLRPRMRFLESKVEETVDVHVAEFMAELGDAVNVYLERLMDGGFITTVDAAWHGRSKRAKQQYQDKLLRDFQELFPPIRQETTVNKLNRAVRRLMESEWQDIATRSGLPKGGTFDPSRIARQVVDHVTKLNAALVAELGALLFLFFVPGGAIIDASLFILALGAGKKVGSKTEQRLQRIKEEARIRLRTERAVFTTRLFEHFNAVNEATGDIIIQRELDTADEHTRRRVEILQREETWRRAAGQLERLVVTAAGMSTTIGLGEGVR